MVETDRVVEIGEVEARLDNLGMQIETALDEDKVLLMKLEILAARCKHTLAFPDKRFEIREKEEEMIIVHGITSPDDPLSRGSSTTDTTTSEKSFPPSRSDATWSTPASLSVLEARALFPRTTSPDDPQDSPSSVTSSPSPRTHLVRKIAYAREQQVRAIMSDMKRRMKRSSSA